MDGESLVGVSASSVPIHPVEGHSHNIVAADPSSLSVPSAPSIQQEHSLWQSLLYPGLHDYDALLRQQLRYRFTEHEFVPLQWKALRAAGWTHAAQQGYVSPGGTRKYGAALELRQALDRFAVSKVVPSNMLRNEDVDENHNDDDDDGKECLRELRNRIIYHMQKLVEESRQQRRRQDPSNFTDKDDHDSPERRRRRISPSRDANTDHDATTRPRRSSRHSAATTTHNSSSQSVTATEKGTDLYLHRNSKKGRKTNKSSSSSTTVTEMSNADEYLVSFPTLEECQKRMAQMDTTACETIESYYRTHSFAAWRHLLSTNHSLLFYGNGSKHRLLSDFCEHELRQEGHAVQIDGFHPDVTMDGILDLLVHLFLDGVEPAVIGRQTTVEETGLWGDPTDDNAQEIDNNFYNHNGARSHHCRRAVAVARALTRHCVTKVRQPIFLVVHSLDGFLRTDRAQESLAALVQHGVAPNSGVSAAIRLVASIDHVDAGAALWSGDGRHEFRWVYKALHTYRPYTAELALLRTEDDEEWLCGGQDSKRNKKKQKKKQAFVTQQEANAVQVLKNLAPSYSEVLQILVRLQLDKIKEHKKKNPKNNDEAEPDAWVEFATFFRECKNHFAVDKESKLRALLSELKDHRLVVSQTARTIEYVRVPYSSVEKLKKILAFERGHH